MRSFETRGPVYPEDNYVVARTEELSDFIHRLEKGRYVVLFAPRQTGKTTFFHRALETLPAEVYFPIQIDFQASNNLAPSEFYQGVYEDIREEIETVFQKRGISASAGLTEFLDNTKITNHLSMRRFFRQFSNFLERQDSRQKVVLVIDEFDGIPQPLVLEQDYFPADTRAGFQDYLTSDGQLHMDALLDNFRDFIARAGFRILQVPETPQEYIGQHLLFAYLEQYVQSVGGTMYLEVRTGRGRMDIIIRDSTSLKPRYGAGIYAMRQEKHNSQPTSDSKRLWRDTTSCLITAKSRNLV